MRAENGATAAPADAEMSSTIARQRIRRGRPPVASMPASPTSRWWRRSGEADPEWLCQQIRPGNVEDRIRSATEAATTASGRAIRFNGECLALPMRVTSAGSGRERELDQMREWHCSIPMVRARSADSHEAQLRILGKQLRAARSPAALAELNVETARRLGYLGARRTVLLDNKPRWPGYQGARRETSPGI
jgi:hypothetical protein